MLVGIGDAPVSAVVAHLCIEAYLPHVALGLGHRIVGLQLPAPEGECMGMVEQSLVEHLPVVERAGSQRVGEHSLQLHFLPDGKMGAQGKHAAAPRTLVGGERTACVQHLQLQLHQLTLAHLPHASLGLPHLVQLLHALQVLACHIHILAGQQQGEEELDGAHRHLLGGCEKLCLGLSIAHGRYTVVPFHGVHAPQGLAQAQCQGQRHKAMSALARQLVEIVERGGEGKGAARVPQVLLHIDGGARLQIVAHHVGVGTRALLIGRIAAAVGRQCG